MIYPRNIRNFIKLFRLQGWYRVFQRDFRATPLGTGPGSSRFSSPSRDFTVLYAAESLRASVCESVIRDRFEEKEADRRITTEELEKYVVAPIQTFSGYRIIKSSSQLFLGVNLIDLSDRENLYKLGLPIDIIGASDHRYGQKFSELAYKDRYVDGILYPSRFVGDMCCVLYDRSLIKLQVPEPKDVFEVARQRRLRADLGSLQIEII